MTESLFGLEKVDMNMIMAHELIHALHNLRGENKGNDNDVDLSYRYSDLQRNWQTAFAPNAEELWTTGLGQYATDVITENALRREQGLERRTTYGIPGPAYIWQNMMNPFAMVGSKPLWPH